MQLNSTAKSLIVETSATFPKIAHLRKRAEFIQLASAKHKITVSGFLIVWQKNDLKVARLGLTVSKKVGSAVLRNKIKRYVREYFRRVRLKLPIVDINVIARHESAQMNFSDVELELVKAFHKIGVVTCSKAFSSL